VTNLLQSTIKRSQIPPPTTAHSATRVRRSRVVRLSRSSRFVMQVAASKCDSAVRLVYPPFCVNFTPHPTADTKIQRSYVWRFRKLYLDKHSVRHLLVCTSFALQWPILSPPTVLTSPPESPCIRHVTFSVSGMYIYILNLVTAHTAGCPTLRYRFINNSARQLVVTESVCLTCTVHGSPSVRPFGPCGMQTKLDTCAFPPRGRT
jgi:hypothetical protein